jgi:thiol-disulfide isomerase/thioredoxin
MKKILLALFLTAFSLQAADIWLTDYDAALKQAAADKKPLILEFTGSDWCPPCKALTANVFEKPAFEEFAKSNVVLVKFDFPRRKEQEEALKATNQAMAKKYQVQGFPTVILVSSSGEEMARKVGYAGETPDSMIEWIKQNAK